VILRPSSIREWLSLNNPEMCQAVEALTKQIARDARHASVNVGEAPGAGQQFPQNQGRPALRENFRSQGDGTKLAIPFHAVEHDLFPVLQQAHFLNQRQSSSLGRKKRSIAWCATFLPSSAPTIVE